jgi:hypothetical protein
VIVISPGAGWSAPTAARRTGLPGPGWRCAGIRAVRELLRVCRDWACICAPAMGLCIGIGARGGGRVPERAIATWADGTPVDAPVDMAERRAGDAEERRYPGIVACAAGLARRSLTGEVDALDVAHRMRCGPSVVYRCLHRSGWVYMGFLRWRQPGE